MHTVTTRKYHVYSHAPDRSVCVAAADMDDAEALACRAWDSLGVDYDALMIRKAPADAPFAISWDYFGDEN